MIPQPCHYCNMLVSRDREGRAVATNPAVAEPWTCPASTSGHLIAAKPETPETTDRAARVFTWDYREQPPIGEIMAEVRKMPAPWFWLCPETGTQEYALVLSNRELNADEAERILWQSVEG